MKKARLIITLATLMGFATINTEPVQLTGINKINLGEPNIVSFNGDVKLNLPYIKEVLSRVENLTTTIENISSAKTQKRMLFGGLGFFGCLTGMKLMYNGITKLNSSDAKEAEQAQINLGVGVLTIAASLLGIHMLNDAPVSVEA